MPASLRSWLPGFDQGGTEDTDCAKCVVLRSGKFRGGRRCKVPTEGIPVVACYRGLCVAGQHSAIRRSFTVTCVVLRQGSLSADAVMGREGINRQLQNDGGREHEMELRKGGGRVAEVRVT